MDKKEDRKFYWSVKDFIQNPVVTPKQPTAKITDVAKSILEQNKTFKQTSFDPNSNMTKVASQAINAIEKSSKGYNPTSQAYTKNSTSNAFNTLNEGYWENFFSGLKEIGSGFSNIIGTQSRSNAERAPSAEEGEEVRQRASQNRARYARNLTPEQLKVTLQAANVVNPEDLAANLLDPELPEEEIAKAEKAFGVVSTVPPLAPTPSQVTAPGGSIATPITAAPTPSSGSVGDDLKDKLDRYRDAFGMSVPTYRPGKRGTESNFQDWKRATDERNAALRAANKELRRERENIRGSLGQIAAEKEKLRVGGKPPAEGTPERKAYDDLVKQQGDLMRSGRSISDATENRGLANTLTQQMSDRQARWESKTGAFKQKTGQDYDINNPEHQNIMRGLVGFKSLERKPLDTDISSGTAPSGSSKSTIPGVALSGDTPDWVRRHAEKFGEESAREIEAMRLGATSVLQGDPTRPMDTSLSAAEVARRGQLLARDRQQYREQNPLTTSGRQTGVGTGRTAAQPESTWDEVARRSVKNDSELANAPLVRRGGKVYAKTANGEIELSTGSMMTSQYADNAPTREQMNRGR